MKYLFLLSLAFGFSIASMAQNQRYFDNDIKIWTHNDSLYINFNDSTIKSGEVLIYKSYESIKINSNFNKTPIQISIKNWEHSWYHIKLDYGLISQFRQYYL